VPAEAIRVASNAEEVRTLFREYADALGVDLGFQGFDDELADPLGFYEVVLVERDAGSVALRRIDDETCEMKRLYVRPESRAGGLGRRLTEAVIAEARVRGYRRMRLDTLPTMAEARRLYASLGFREIAPYRPNPIAGTTYLELEL